MEPFVYTNTHVHPVKFKLRATSIIMEEVEVQEKSISMIKFSNKLKNVLCLQLYHLLAAYLL